LAKVIVPQPLGVRPLDGLKSPNMEETANHPNAVRPPASVVFGLFLVLSVLASAAYVFYSYLT